MIYEYALADIDEGICIKVDRGYKEPHRGRWAKNKERRLKVIEGRVLQDDEDDVDEVSNLALLLTCKQINKEASPIAYSKMSMTITKLPSLSSIKRAWNATSEMCRRFSNGFSGDKLKYVKTLVLPDAVDILQLLCCIAWRWFPDTKVLSQADHIICQFSEDYLSYIFGSLTDGASWLSVVMDSDDGEDLVEKFPRLQFITARRDCGDQVSKVVDGEIFAAESGMRMRGMVDWINNPYKG